MTRSFANHLLAAGAAVTVSLLAAMPVRAANVGVSVSVGQPGFYGRIDIGSYPQPQLIYPQPVVIAPQPVVVQQSPIYLRVPPGHAKNWGKFCGRYNACGQRVYFVQDDWYNRVYAPAYRERLVVERREHGRPDHDRGDDRRDDDHDHGHGNGRGHGNGNGRGHDGR